MSLIRLKRALENERRTEPRYLCAELVRVQVKSEPWSPTEVANLEDISPSGACLQFERAVEMGADVEIRCKKCRLRGKVRHCRFAGIGWDVGVQFDRKGAWTRERFEPEHLLDVEEFERRARAAQPVLRAAGAGG
jgi:hypothetical protein